MEPHHHTRVLSGQCRSVQTQPEPVAALGGAQRSPTAPFFRLANSTKLHRDPAPLSATDYPSGPEFVAGCIPCRRPLPFNIDKYENRFDFHVQEWLS
jgi:hypothetical protein